MCYKQETSYNKYIKTGSSSSSSSSSKNEAIELI